MKAILRKVSLAGIGTVLFVLALFTFIAVLAGLFFSDALIVGLLVLILDAAILSLHLLVNQREVYREKLENLSKRIDEKPNTHEVEKSIKRNKHEIDDVVKKHTANLYKQTESFQYIQQLINPVKPLPSMSGWAASPELALLIYNVIAENKYKTIVDLGSGVSSLVASYAIKQTGKGTVVSIDHEEEFYEKTKQTIQEHGLQNTTDLRYVPLRMHKVNKTNYEWYDTEKIQDVKDIDLLIVDGPPGKTQKHARYPALPLLYDRLSNGATVILDDYFRTDETEITEMWAKEYNLDFYIGDSSKGVAILKKH